MNIDQTTLILYGAAWCDDSKRVKTVLETNRLPFTYINIDLNKETVRQVEELQAGKRLTPTLVVNEASFVNPSNEQMASMLGLNDGKPRVRLFGADWCPDCQRAKAYLGDNHINFQYINIDVHTWAIPVLETVNHGKRIIPTIFLDDQAYANPNNRTLKERIGIQEDAQSHLYDVAIIGGGAAGLTTAIYAQRDKYSSVILEKRLIGGNASLTDTIENYPGFINISGEDLMHKMADQARTYGAVMKLGADVRTIREENELFHLETTMGDITARSVVLAVGSTYKRLNIPGETELIGAGIHFCATCDGAFYRDREVIVIGGGNSALEEGMFLARFCKRVTFVHYKPAFSASATYTDKLSEMTNISLLMNRTPTTFLGNGQGTFCALQVTNNSTGEVEEIKADGVFLFIGLIPNTRFLAKTIQLNEQGFICTRPGSVETSVPGIMAAGDCREGAIAQVAAATGEGVVASFAIKAYLNKQLV
ncbi:MAG: pyridine nucleotide-disulfide oxidoreductase [Spirosoma sp.]|nr:pyridine nucleotide-disulfide oxidoreductase [Spirosoma sp.]